MKCVSLLVVLALVQCAVGGMRSNKDLRESAVVVVNTPGEYRSFEANWEPPVHPRFINLTGVELKYNENHAEGSVASFIMDTFNQSTIAFAYYAAEGNINGNNSNLDIAAFQFFFRSFAVFEYAERNNVPGFQNGTTDLLTGFYDLSSPDLKWKDLDIESMNVTVNGTELSVFFITAETLDSVFTIRFIVTGAYIEVEGKTLNPTTCKIDVDIKWFTEAHVAAAWTTGPSLATFVPNARVGVVSLLAAGAGEFSTSNSSPLNNSNPTFIFESAAAVGFFSYETTADVTANGQQAVGSVHATTSAEVNGYETNSEYAANFIARLIWFSFDGIRPSEVSWDPEFGATPKTASPSTSTTTADTSSVGYFMPSIASTVACAIFAML